MSTMFLLQEALRGAYEQAGDGFTALWRWCGSDEMSSPSGTWPAEGNGKSGDSEIDAAGKKIRSTSLAETLK